MKDKTTAIILSALLGGLGVDRFYLGYTGMGVLKLLTGGCLGVLWILDIIWIATGKLQPANGMRYSEETTVAAHNRANSDPYEYLKKLSQLKEQGIVNEEEFARLKSELLSKM